MGSGDPPAVRSPGPDRSPAVRQRVWIVAAETGFVVGLLVLTWWVGVRSTAFTGVPKGGDALDHAATIQLLMENFPHLLWNNAWFGGLPSVPGLYPPGYSLLIAAAVTAFGTSIQHAMVVCAAAAYLVISASLYGFVRVLSGSRTAAVLAGLLVLTAPGLWDPSLDVGEYPRLTAMALGYLATFIAALYTVKPSRLRLTGAIIVTGLAFACHPVTGGLGAAQVLGVLALVPGQRRRERLRTAAAAAAAVAGLAAWLYVPSLIGVHAYYILPQARFTSSAPGSATAAAPLGYLLYPAAHSLHAFSPILVPLALLLTGIAAVVVWRRRAVDGPGGRVFAAAAAMLIVAACVLGYAFAGWLTSASVELVGIYPADMFSYAAWPLAAVSGLLIAALLALVPEPERAGRSILVFAVVFAGAFACLLAMVPVFQTDAFAYQRLANALAPQLPRSDATGQYRIGLTDQVESSWINIFTRTPEVGGAFNQGALNLDYVTWAEDMLTAPPTLDQAEFSEQWNALRWIEAAPRQQGFYQANPAVYRYVGASASYRNYEVRQPSPVLAATDAPPVLVIGPYENYNLLLRSLAVTDDGPDRVIPVQGSTDIDDYTLAQLAQFPVLFLYGFQAHDPARAAALLSAYVRAGGGLIADVAGDSQLAAQLARDGTPLPVTSWTSAELSGRWDFQPTSSPLTHGIELGAFAAPVYAGTQPYLVEVAQQLAPGAAVALQSGPRPLLVTGTAGHGRVAESGMNLPYHDAVFANAAESALLARMIQTVTARSWARAPLAPGGAVLTADSARVQAGSAEGVLFKETDTPDWHATVDGHAVATYPAGLGDLYVRLPAGTGASAAVEFRYQLSGIEWASVALSVLTLLLVLAFLSHARLPAWLRSQLTFAFSDLIQPVRPRTTEVQATRQQLAALLADPSPAVRRTALRALPLDHLEPYADLLAAQLACEPDSAVLAAMRDLVVMHQWEPVASAPLLELRVWAARTGQRVSSVTRN